MDFERHRFTDAASLTAAARASVRQGLYVTVGRDQDEPCLAWIDRLAARRSDWLPPIAATLTALAANADADARSAAVEWFRTARTAPALAATARVIVDAGDPESLAGRAFDPQAAPVALSSLLPALTQQAARNLARPQQMLFSRPRTALVAVADLADVVRECQVAIAHGDSRIGGGLDGWYVLDWLRRSAYFTPWVRAEVPAALAALVDSAAGAQAVVQYAALAGDKRELAAILKTWLDERPQWAEVPAAFTGAPGGTLAACLEAALAGAAAEAATAPG